MTLRTLLPALLALVFVVACGGGTKTDTTPKQEEDTDGACKVDESVKATFKPAPKHTGCMDKERWASQAKACSESKDPEACYQIGVCVKLQSLGSGLTDASKQKHFDAVLKAMRVSCDAGMGQACLFRAGVLSEALKEQPNRTDWKKQRCGDYVQACRLGTKDACYGCTVTECQSYTP